jgi:hypothetical protein
MMRALTWLRLAWWRAAERNARRRAELARCWARHHAELSADFRAAERVAQAQASEAVQRTLRIEARVLLATVDQLLAQRRTDALQSAEDARARTMRAAALQ